MLILLKVVGWMVYGAILIILAYANMWLLERLILRWADQVQEAQEKQRRLEFQMGKYLCECPEAEAPIGEGKANATGNGNA